MVTICEFYDRRPERERLLRGIGLLESARTRGILSQLLPTPPATVYDVGGGTGHYAGWLAKQGYSTHLLDCVPQHVIDAARDHDALTEAVVGDARALPWLDATADAVLLMGPLYHLTERRDRTRALREAARVVRPNGFVFAVIIPRWASTLVGMLQGFTADPAYAEMLGQELSTGQHEPPVSQPNLFMSGFFHSQADIRSEVAEAGLEFGDSLAIEGPAWMWKDFEDAWGAPDQRAAILDLARRAERDPEVLGTSPHVAVICRRRAN